MLQIQEKTKASKIALFELGFRPFFVAAALFATLGIGVWIAMFIYALPWVPAEHGGILWHGHEMVFGYAMAVIAGFLLTAVGNWTGVPGLRGAPLIALLGAWLVARVAFFVPGDGALAVAAASDVVFTLGLIVAVMQPVVQVAQWKQLGLISKLVLVLLCNMAFYAGGLEYWENVTLPAIYAGLYVIIALLFTMARRVVPFFIERGGGGAVVVRNRRWVDIGSLVLFLLWAVSDVFFDAPGLVGVLSLLLVAIHLFRLYDWFAPGTFMAPLLWSLYLGYGFLVLGFLLKALSIWSDVPSSLALHAFTFGGIGLMTIGMMARVGLGHTGRNVFDPPKVLTPLFALLLLGALVRVIAPLIDPPHYLWWIVISQVLWVLAFSGFLVVYFPILASPRVDWRPG